MADIWYFDSRPKLHHVPIQSVRMFEEIAEQVSDRVIDAEAV